MNKCLMEYGETVEAFLKGIKEQELMRLYHLPGRTQDVNVEGLWNVFQAGMRSGSEVTPGPTGAPSPSADGLLLKLLLCERGGDVIYHGTPGSLFVQSQENSSEEHTFMLSCILRIEEQFRGSTLAGEPVTELHVSVTTVTQGGRHLTPLNTAQRK